VSDPAAAYKRQAAEAALEQVRSGMVLGLGTGSTAAFVIAGVGERLADGRLKNITAVPTSLATAGQAETAGIPLVGLRRGGIDLAIDGCDEFDPALDLIKGLGGALTREKLVAREAERFLVVADDSKAVNRLGEKAPVPVEILEFGHAATLARLGELGGTVELRRAAGGAPVVSDNGNLIADFRPDGPFSAEELGRQLKAVTGVLEHGLFPGLADEVLVAGAGGVRTVSAG